VDRLGKVKWTNNGKVEHNFTFQGGYSRNLGPGESVVKKFNRAGKFPYSCTIHPEMTGKVKVVAPAVSGTRLRQAWRDKRRPT
jgi:plastocyanin